MATGPYVNAYAWARAVITDPDYAYQTGDKIQFTLTGVGTSFYGTTSTVVTLPVGMLDSGEFGVDSQSDLKFQSTGAEQVTLSAVLGRDAAVAGSRDFTFKALPVASATNLGCVVVGEGLAVTGNDGTTSLAPASTTQLGGVMQGDYVTIDSGKLSVDPAALTPHLTHARGSDYGTAKAGAGLTNTNGVFAVDYSAVVDNLRHADAGSYGVVKPGTGMSASNGVLNVNAASASAAGIVALASDAEVAAGTDNATAVTPKGAKHVYAPLADPHLTGTVSVTQETDDVKMQVVKSTTSAGTAATTLGTQSIYLQLGGGEYKTNSYRMVGLGFRDPSRPIPPLLVGLEETDSAGATKGDFLVATRDSTAYSAPTEKFRITSDGRAKVTNDQTANDYTVQDQELVTKKYVDEKYVDEKYVDAEIAGPDYKQVKTETEVAPNDLINGTTFDILKSGLLTFPAGSVAHLKLGARFSILNSAEKPTSLSFADPLYLGTTLVSPAELVPLGSGAILDLVYTGSALKAGLSSYLGVNKQDDCGSKDIDYYSDINTLAEAP